MQATLRELLRFVAPSCGGGNGLKNQDSSAAKAGGTDNKMLDKRFPGFAMGSIGGVDFDVGVRRNATV